MSPSTLRVLVVDDSDTIRALIVLNLQLEDFEVAEACDGQDCLDRVAQWHPDVVTLDVAMPRLDGFETAARLRAEPQTAHIPIVMVTARAQGSDLSRAEEIGVDAFVSKPFEPGRLVEIIRSVAAEESRC